MKIFEGSGVAIVTPLKDNLIDYEKFSELIEWHIKNQTDAIIVCGTTGESATLSIEEKKQLITFTVEKVNKRIPVIAGTGSYDTASSIEMSQYAELVGADALLIVTPYYNKTSQNGLIAHYTAIADQVNIPIIMYNVPSRTGLNLLPDTVAQLSKHRLICAVKEASGDISQVAKIANLCSEDFYIYSGNDDQIIPILSLGGKGVISVVANILPKETHDMVTLYLNGQMLEARNLQIKMLNLINALFIETNPIPVKEAMNLLGMSVGNYRLPLIKMEEKNKQILINQMKTYGLDVKQEV